MNSLPAPLTHSTLSLSPAKKFDKVQTKTIEFVFLIKLLLCEICPLVTLCAFQNDWRVIRGVTEGNNPGRESISSNKAAGNTPRECVPGKCRGLCKT